MIYYVMNRNDEHIVAEYEDRNEAYLAAEADEALYVYVDFD